jgi:hypothetical protein
MNCKKDEIHNILKGGCIFFILLYFYFILRNLSFSSIYFLIFISLYFHFKFFFYIKFESIFNFPSMANLMNTSDQKYMVIIKKQ